MKRLFLGCALVLISAIFLLYSQEEVHEFKGHHFVASYSGCNHEALSDVETLKKVMLMAVETCGATVLDAVDYVFHPDGLTMVILLSESHASIHTYPEYDACFVDLFTCGDKCSAEKFDLALREYLHPKQIAQKMLLRQQTVEVRP